MNLVELKKKLDDLGIDEQAYSLGNAIEDEQYCMEKIGRKWHYYYSERGQKAGERSFEKESEACEYMYSILKSDPTVKSR
ncbi:MAG: hypothetical protein V3V12_09890 [Gammaproteobacteria bacterium]